MKKYRWLIMVLLGITLLFTLGASSCSETSEQDREAKKVNMQQGQYAKGQPIPAFNWSLERDLIVKLYSIRNKKVATHAVWRSAATAPSWRCEQVVRSMSSSLPPAICAGRAMAGLTPIPSAFPGMATLWPRASAGCASGSGTARPTTQGGLRAVAAIF